MVIFLAGHCQTCTGLVRVIPFSCPSFLFCRLVHCSPGLVVFIQPNKHTAQTLNSKNKNYLQLCSIDSPSFYEGAPS